MQVPNAAELWKQHQSKSEEEAHDLQPNKKCEDVDGSFSQAQDRQCAQRRFRKHISSEKVDKLGSLCIGKYDATLNKVILEKLKGKLWSHCGYSDGARMLLHPEEAYFLMDIGALRVYYNDLTLSLQEASGYFFNMEELSLNHYLVYSHLSRLGFIVRRFTDPSSIKRCSLDQKSKRKKKLPTDEHPAELLRAQESFPEPAAKLVKECQDLGIEQMVAKDDIVETEITMDQDDFAGKSKPLSAEQETKSIKYTQFDYTGIEFPVCGGMRPKLETDEVPSTAYHSEAWPVAAASNLTDHFSQFSVMGYNATKVSSAATCWREFKDEHSKRLAALDNDLQLDPRLSLVGHPCEIDEFSNLLDMLQLSETKSLNSLNENRKFHPNSLMFDVYQPNPNFRKSEPGDPHHRIVVVHPDDTVPSLSDIALLHSIKDDVPFYWAICDGGDISFYSQTQESIERDLYQTRKRSKKI